MKILLWHGYLMTGSGSNVYTANIARSWRRSGHDVLVLCQERHADALGFVDETGGFAPDNSSFETTSVRVAAPASGRCRVVRPSIGEILPVYVYDAYEGITAKTFVDLSDAELAAYTERNVTALVTAIRGFHPDVIITGHEVMGPYIARLACAQTSKSYVAKLHGSALEYAVKKQDRYRRFAIEGLRTAHRVVGGSRYMIKEAAAHIPGWEERSAVVNPGCDLDIFKPVPRSANHSRVGFVGKLIASKGVHNLLAALPLSRHAGSATIVGYGGFATRLEALASALAAGDLGAARSIAEAGETGPLADLMSFLGAPPEEYLTAAARFPVEFTGRLEHGPLSALLPSFDLLVVPSVVPEAFGMVAAEAAAVGVLPVVPAHSGIGEAGAAIEEAIGRPGLLSYDPADPINGIAAAIDRVLSLELEERRVLEEKAVALARAHWSWDHVAAQLLELAAA